MSEAAGAREEMHHRQVDIRFYQRADGRYEVEGRLTDVKQQAFRRQLATEDSPPGSTLHDISVVLVIDDALVVHEARASMAATPFDICPGAEGTLQPLVGLSIASGWNKRVRELLGGRASCTHIVELLGPMATTAFQGLAPQRLARLNDPDPANDAARLKRVDGCYAYRAEREVVARLWPHLAKPADKPESPDR